MRILRRTLCFFMLIGVLLIGMTNQVHAKTTYSEGYFYYQIEDESITITGYFGTKETVVLPISIAGYPVSKIAKGAFWETKTVKELHLPETIMEIEQEAISTHIQVVYDHEKSEVPDEGGNDTDVEHSTGNNTGSSVDDNGGSPDFDVEEVEGNATMDTDTNTSDAGSDTTTNTNQNGEDGKDSDKSKDSVEVSEKEDVTKPSGEWRVWTLVIAVAFLAVTSVSVFLILRKKRQTNQ